MVPGHDGHQQGAADAVDEDYDMYEGDEVDGEGDEAYSSDEEFDRTHYGIAQALPVPDGPPDLSAGPPQTAEEYLQWVRYEASQRPRITRKEIDPEKLQRGQQVEQGQPAQGQQHAGPGPSAGAGAGVAGGGRGGGRRGVQPLACFTAAPVVETCQEWARPQPKWLRAFLQDFAQLRQALGGMQHQHVNELAATRLPAVDDAAAWERLCFEQWQPLEEEQRRHEQGAQRQGAQQGQEGGGAGDGGEAEQQQPGPPPGQPGTGSGGETDRLCGPVLRTVLAMDQVCVSGLIVRHVAALASQPSLSYMRSQWLFALTAALERPVPPDVAAALRDLVRQCAAWRAGLAAPQDPALPRLNILLAVAGGYFGQDEQLCGVVGTLGLGDLA